MLKALRILALLGTPLVFWGAWYVMPGVLGSSGLRWMAGIVTVLWGFEFYFFQRLSVISSVDGLTSKEHEKLVLRLASLRKRVWWIGGIGMISSVLIWIMAAQELPTTSPIYAALVGFLFGISLSYMILIPGWFNESQHFIDEVRRRDSLAKKIAETSKALLSPKQ